MHTWLDFVTKLHKYNSFAYMWLTTKECKNLDVVVPDQLLAANVDAIAYQMEQYKNSSLVVILHCLNSFHHNNYMAFWLLYALLKGNHKINAACFPLFHNGCNPTCKVWRMLRTGESAIKNSNKENDMNIPFRYRVTGTLLCLIVGEVKLQISGKNPHCP